ncbi:MAG: hypothetical protein FWE53_02915 [Firmicutes bacterium]|nr:hypothetical protein [Bacillota bacterium]
MEKNNLGEQLPLPEAETALTEKADVSSEPGGSQYGKFNSANELKAAYDNLEKEFTRKSQLLAELNKQNKTTAELASDPEVVKLVSDKSEVKEKIINDYVISLSAAGRSPELIYSSVGAFNMGDSRSTPKTLGEAKLLAKQLIEK